MYIYNLQYQRTHIRKTNIERPVGRVGNILKIDFQLSTFKNTFNIQAKNY